MVLIILPALRSGGTEWQLLELLRNSTSQDPILLWVYDINYDEEMFFLFDKITNVRIVFGKSLRTYILIIKSKPKVIISYAINYYVPEIIVKIISKANLITERRNLYYWLQIKKRNAIQEFVRNWITDLIICNSYEVQRIAIKFERFISSKTTVIYNSVSIPNFATSCLLPDITHVVTVSNIKKGKGIERVVKAFLDSSSLYINSVYSIFGRLDDPSVFNDIDIDHVNLFYKGFRRKEEIYSFGSILVHLSESEGFPNVVLEALAAGMQVIISDIPVHRELFSGNAEFVAPDECASIYINKLIEIRLLSKATYTKSCQANIAFAKTFSHSKRSIKYWKLIHGLG